MMKPGHLDKQPTHALAHETCGAFKGFQRAVSNCRCVDADRLCQHWSMKKKGRAEARPFLHWQAEAGFQLFGVQMDLTRFASKAAGTCLKQA